MWANTRKVQVRFPGFRFLFWENAITQAEKARAAAPRHQGITQRLMAIRAALTKIEQARTSMRSASQDLVALIEEDPDREWPRRWQAFLDDGGISADELEQWRNKRHLIRTVSRQQSTRSFLALTQAGFPIDGL
jgi:hypothetical protein